MNLVEVAKEIHADAVQQGLWNEKQNDAEIITSIHLQWSRALEEYRSGSPLVQYNCRLGLDGIACPGHWEDDIKEYEFCVSNERCENKSPKPEGVAIELIDGCIQILDYLAKIEAGEDVIEVIERKITEADIYPTFEFTHLVALLHSTTSCTMDDECKGVYSPLCFAVCFHLVFWWIRKQGFDPWKIMREKLDFDKGQGRLRRHLNSWCEIQIRVKEGETANERLL